jgi:uncharacterized protein involved in response to NO
MSISARNLLVHERARPRTSAAFLEKGFRPFFLGGAVFAAVAVPLWLVALLGGVTPGGAFGPMQWHAHEMLFGYATAIIAGFLLTAISNWTSRETLSGAPLAALAALWALGRVTLFFADYLPRVLPPVIDLSFLPALAFVCARPILAAHSRRNYGFLAMLGLLCAANVSAHLGAWHQNTEQVRSAHRVALDVIMLMIVVMTGRVVPMFTRNATRLAWIRGLPALEIASVLGMVALLVLDLLPSAPRAGGLLAAVTALMLFSRMRYWGSVHTRREPLLWILHLGTLWVPIGLTLRALSVLTTFVPASSAVHALTAGSLGALTLGMMARVSLGHTGRMLKAPRSMTVAFASLTLAGILRVAAPLLPGAFYLHLLECAALVWSLAFGLFVAGYFRFLVSARVDGR